VNRRLVPETRPLAERSEQALSDEEYSGSRRLWRGIQRLYERVSDLGRRLYRPGDETISVGLAIALADVVRIHIK
jgi:hypothetical protein